MHAITAKSVYNNTWIIGIIKINLLSKTSEKESKSSYFIILKKISLTHWDKEK